MILVLRLLIILELLTQLVVRDDYLIGGPLFLIAAGQLSEIAFLNFS